MAEFKAFKTGETEAQFRQFFSHLFSQSGFLKARTGVMGPGPGLQVKQTTTASGSILVSGGLAIAQDTTLNGVSPLVSNVTDTTLDVLGANPMGGVPRNDVVVFDAATESLRVLVGTPNATPTDPTVPATAVALGRIRHSAGATTVPSSAIDDLRAFVTTRGGVQRIGSQAERDALPLYYASTIYRTDSKNLEIYNGSDWDVYSPRGASGTRSIGQVAANSFATWTVTFPTGRFSSAPRVTVSASTGRLCMAVRNVTATSCTVEAYNASTVATSADGEFFTWIAVPF